MTLHEVPARMPTVHVRVLLAGAPVAAFHCNCTDETVTSTYGFVRVIVMKELLVDISN